MKREEAIVILDGFKHNPLFNEQHFEALDMAISALSENKGEWIDGYPICPCCGEDKFKGLEADIYADWKPNFCPNCGADMRGE